ncbi:MAG: glycosyltransferase [Pseudomonadota bacterium]
MNVLAITSLFPTPIDPQAGRFNLAQLSEVAASDGVSVLVAIRWPLFLKRGGKNRETVSGGTLKIVPTPYLYPPGLAYGWHGHFFWASIRGQVRKLARETRFDVVYGMFAYPDGWAAAQAAQELGVPLVLKVHGSDIHRLRHDRSRRYRLSEALGRAKRIVAVSEQLAGEVREIAPGITVRVVRNGVDHSAFPVGSKEEAREKLGFPRDQPVVLFVGRMEPVKGADLLPEIAGSVKHPVRWVLIGLGSEASRIVSRMPDGFTRWIPGVPHDRIGDYYRAADLVLIPSRREGIPNSLLEALASDRPVVASAVGGIPEILTDAGGGRLVASMEPDSFAHAIDDLLTHPPEKGRAAGMVSMVRWETSGRELRSVLAEAIQ